MAKKYAPGNDRHYLALHCNLVSPRTVSQHTATIDINQEA